MRNRYIICVLFILLFDCLLSGCAKPHVANQGYIEGRYTYIAANFSGVLEILAIKRGMTVEKNQPLFSLEMQPEQSTYDKIQAKLVEAKANVIEKQAAVKLAQLSRARRQQLLAKGHVEQEAFDRAQQELDQHQAELQQAQANVNAIQAELTQAQWSVQKKTVYAPKNGFVFDTYFLPGELVPANQPVVSLLSPQDIYLLFFVGEPELSRYHLGQKIKFTCDNCKDDLSATVSYISPKAEFTPPIIYSDERRSKLVYRIEAIPDSENTTLHPGQPVTVSMY
jgi:HlyD family secretion protein